MEARTQQLSDEFNQQILGIQQRVEEAHYANTSKMDHLLAAFQQMGTKVTEASVQGGAGSPSAGERGILRTPHP